MEKQKAQSPYIWTSPTPRIMPYSLLRMMLMNKKQAQAAAYQCITVDWSWPKRTELVCAS